MSECNSPPSTTDLQAYAPIAYYYDATSPLLPNYSQRMKKKNFDQFIATEMSKMRNLLAEDESRYVEEKLAENQMELELRTTSPNSSGGESSSRSNNGHPEPTINISPEQQTIRGQRAASCRKSRMNNKLKKTTLQYRNEFMCNKVSDLKVELDEMERQIKIAEEKFLAMGRTRVELVQMRAIYGVNEQ